MRHGHADRDQIGLEGGLRRQRYRTIEAKNV
jgi:hypothetical protein